MVPWSSLLLSAARGSCQEGTEPPGQAGPVPTGLINGQWDTWAGSLSLSLALSEKGHPQRKAGIWQKDLKGTGTLRSSSQSGEGGTRQVLLDSTDPRGYCMASRGSAPKSCPQPGVLPCRVSSACRSHHPHCPPQPCPAACLTCPLPGCQEPLHLGHGCGRRGSPLALPTQELLPQTKPRALSFPPSVLPAAPAGRGRDQELTV